MEYKIKKQRLMEVMEKVFQEIYDIKTPLKIYNGNKGFLDKLYGKFEGTPYEAVQYMSGENTIFMEYRGFAWSRKWDVDDKLQPFYKLFGREAFEDFVKYYFDIDLVDLSDNKFSFTDKDYSLPDKQESWHFVAHRDSTILKK